MLALILIPRLHNLDALVTADERFWMARSANFYQALSSGDLKYTDQFIHPGVTVMWLGAAGYMLSVPELPDLMGGQIPTRERHLPDLLNANGYSTIDVLVELRRIETIFSALVLVAVFVCLSRITTTWRAFGAVLFVSLDPMHIGFTRLLHLDGLSTNLLLLSLVAFTWRYERHSRTALLISGVAAGLAFLTRSANLMLIPLFGMIAFLEVSTDPFYSGRSLIRRGLDGARALLPWLLTSIVTFVACWPAMWVAPSTTVRRLFTQGADLAAEPHTMRVLFLGNVTNNDPGLLYYPVVFAYRVSPLTLIGLTIVILALGFKRELASQMPNRLIKHLLLFSIIYTMLLSIASKKLDRYLLSSIVSLDLVAGFGLVAAGAWAAPLVARRLRAPNVRLSPAVVAILLLVQSTLAVAADPFYIDVANPLLGGASGAREQFSSAWGDGGKEVAEALLQLDGIEGATVTGSIWPQTIDAYLPFAVQAPFYTLDLRAAGQWMMTDYLVLTYPEVQRMFYPEPMRAWFASHQPIRTVYASGLEYAWIYNIRNAPLPPAFEGVGSPSIVWDDLFRLDGVLLPSRLRSGETIEVELLFDADKTPTSQLVSAELVSPDGVAIPITFEPTPAPVGEYDPAVLMAEVTLPFDLAPGMYDLRVDLTETSGLVIPAVDAGTDEVVGPFATVGTIRLLPLDAHLSV